MMRLFYAAGPGDIVGTFRNWAQGSDDRSQLALTYSGQFFDLCRQLDANGLAVSSHGRRDDFTAGKISALHLPRASDGKRGLAWHMSQIRYGLALSWMAIRHRADLMVVADGSAHWFSFALANLFGIRVVPSLHCVLWPKTRTPSRTERWVQAVDRALFWTRVRSVLVASEDIVGQLRQVVGGTRPPDLRPFLPTYRAELFEGFEPRLQRDQMFRFLFIGRIVREKGVFDLLSCIQVLRSEGRSVELDFCGTGDALSALNTEIARLGLVEAVRTHGHCEQSQLRTFFRRADAIVVPTRTSFVEGFNQVVVESILACRPVISSAVCPALALVPGAAIECIPDDVASYAEAMRTLMDQPEVYHSKAAACSQYRAAFFDPARGWCAALREICITSMPKPIGTPGVAR